MKRENLEHLIRSAGAISECKEIIVIGSQSILGMYPNAPKEALTSMEADLIPVGDSHFSDLVDGAIGELSAFHETFGYYADGVSEATAVLPNNWKDRLVTVQNSNTNGYKGLCLDPHDMAISKLVAGREKDLDVCSILCDNSLLNKQTLLDRLKITPVDDAITSQITKYINLVTKNTSR